MKNLLLILCILSSISVFGQYNYFSNIDQNQVYNNVSFTGSNCGPRLQTSFKNFKLFSSNLNYGYLSYDQPIKLKNGDYIGIGGRIMMYNNPFYDNRSSSFLTSYNRQVSNKNGVKQFLSLGVGFTLANIKTDQDHLRWPSQIGPDGFDPDLPGESINGHFFYPEIEIGLSYSLMKNKNEYVKTGIGIKSINQPNISFLGRDPVPLLSTWVISAMGSTKASEKLYWQPQVRLYTRQGDRLISLVSNFKFLLNNESNGIIVGASYADNKVITPNLGIEIGRLSAIFSYDFNLNSSVTTFVNPSLEFGLGYRFCD